MKNEYYKQFIYRIEKKITVEDYPKIKDYAKKGVYLYIIHDTIDNNRFLYLSSKHYEEETKLNSETFNLVGIAGTQESIHLNILTSRFGVKYFELHEEKGDFSIIFKDIIYTKTKENKFFKKFKTHIKKIALENPEWYIEYILNDECQSHKKKLLKNLLYENKYNEEIIKHTISSLFILNNPDYQKFNDHNIILDEGKTGKSSLIGYMGEKLDNISVAGLYGSSDSKRGKFKGGIITTTNKSILIDEMNELIKNNKGDKILSVLNSLLENGVYNYQKQFGQKIYSSNQFYFMGNIGNELNFPLFLLGSFGNIETLGRRIGIITYNTHLNGYKMGLIRPSKPTPYLNAISIFLSNIFNEILQDKKFIKKLYSHIQYKKLSQYYKGELTKISNSMEEEITKQFIRSHSSSIDRVICRSLKLWIYEHLDDFIYNRKSYDNHSIFEILTETEKNLKSNILNFENIKEHINNFCIEDKENEFNKLYFSRLIKTQQNLLRFFWNNRFNINIKGVEYEKLEDLSLIRFTIKDYKSRGIPQKHIMFLQQYGLNLTMKNDKIMFRIINKNLFENKLKGIFKELEESTTITKSYGEVEQINIIQEEEENLI